MEAEKALSRALARLSEKERRAISEEQTGELRMFDSRVMFDWIAAERIQGADL